MQFKFIYMYTWVCCVFTSPAEEKDQRGCLSRGCATRLNSVFCILIVPAMSLIKDSVLKIKSAAHFKTKSSRLWQSQSVLLLKIDGAVWCLGYYIQEAAGAQIPHGTPF